ncbi:MAG: ribonuclease P protein component [Puniceicoccaceae bacterium]
MRFSREHRIRKSGEFERLRKEGRWIPGRHFHLQVGERGCAPSRLGLAVSRRVGPAVVRNRIKRRFRALFRAVAPELRTPLDIVVIARKGVDRVSFSDLKRDFLHSLRFWHSHSPRSE